MNLGHFRLIVTEVIGNLPVGNVQTEFVRVCVCMCYERHNFYVKDKIKLGLTQPVSLAQIWRTCI